MSESNQPPVAQPVEEDHSLGILVFGGIGFALCVIALITDALIIGGIGFAMMLLAASAGDDDIDGDGAPEPY